jgi:hypothetical protein
VYLPPYTSRRRVTSEPSAYGPTTEDSSTPSSRIAIFSGGTVNQRDEIRNFLVTRFRKFALLFYIFTGETCSTAQMADLEKKMTASGSIFHYGVDHKKGKLIKGER